MTFLDSSKRFEHHDKTFQSLSHRLSRLESLFFQPEPQLEAQLALVFGIVERDLGIKQPPHLLYDLG